MNGEIMMMKLYKLHKNGTALKVKCWNMIIPNEESDV